VTFLLAAQNALRSRFDEFRLALQRENRTAAEIALDDFEKNFRRWSEAEEKALMPALVRAAISGRDVRRELRLEGDRPSPPRAGPLSGKPCCSRGRARQSLTVPSALALVVPRRLPS